MSDDALLARAARRGHPAFGNFASDRHCLYVGWVLGLALRKGMDVGPVTDDDGNYTDRLRFHDLAPFDGTMACIELVVPPPPHDWWALPHPVEEQP